MKVFTFYIRPPDQISVASSWSDDVRHGNTKRQIRNIKVHRYTISGINIRIVGRVQRRKSSSFPHPLHNCQGHIQGGQGVRPVPD